MFRQIARTTRYSTATSRKRKIATPSAQYKKYESVQMSVPVIPYVPKEKSQKIAQNVGELLVDVSKE